MLGLGYFRNYEAKNATIIMQIFHVATRLVAESTRRDMVIQVIDWHLKRLIKKTLMLGGGRLPRCLSVKVNK